MDTRRERVLSFYLLLWIDLSYLVPDGAPRNLTAVSNSSTTVYLTWVEPLESLQNGEITGYRIRYSGKDGSVSELLTNETHYLLKRLVKYTCYNISVEARTEVGFGPLGYINVTTSEDGRRLYIFFLSSIFLLFVFYF